MNTITKNVEQQFPKWIILALTIVGIAVASFFIYRNWQYMSGTFTSVNAIDGTLTETRMGPSLYYAYYRDAETNQWCFGSVHRRKSAPTSPTCLSHVSEIQITGPFTHATNDFYMLKVFREGFEFDLSYLLIVRDENAIASNWTRSANGFDIEHHDYNEVDDSNVYQVTIVRDALGISINSVCFIAVHNDPSNLVSYPYSEQDCRTNFQNYRNP